MTATTSPVGQSGAPMSSNQVKYYELLARYYVLKRQHMLAAHALLRLAERRSIDGVPTLELRLIKFSLSLSLSSLFFSNNSCFLCACDDSSSLTCP